MSDISLAAAPKSLHKTPVDFASNLDLLLSGEFWGEICCLVFKTDKKKDKTGLDCMDLCLRRALNYLFIISHNISPLFNVLRSHFKPEELLLTCLKLIFMFICTILKGLLLLSILFVLLPLAKTLFCSFLNILFCNNNKPETSSMAVFYRLAEHCRWI